MKSTRNGIELVTRPGHVQPGESQQGRQGGLQEAGRRDGEHATRNGHALFRHDRVQPEQAGGKPALHDQIRATPGPAQDQRGKEIVQVRLRILWTLVVTGLK